MLKCRRHILNIQKTIIIISRNNRRTMYISFIYPVIYEREIKVTLSFNSSVSLRWIRGSKNTIALLLNFLLLFSDMLLDLLVFSIKAFSISLIRGAFFLFSFQTFSTTLEFTTFLSSLFLQAFSYFKFLFWISSFSWTYLYEYVFLIGLLNIISVFM